jgi:hypothetical protein
MNPYVFWVTTYPIASAVVQFGVLGTLGELLSVLFRTRQWRLAWSLRDWAGKILAWAILGIMIKLGFIGMRGFVEHLAEHGYVPEIFSSGLGFAFALSVSTNIFFGPQMMAVHRLEDNIIGRVWNWHGLTKAWFTLIWFWIPAHTLTFALPKEYQIGLAAVWSVVLGIILGLTSSRSPARS